MERSAPRRYLLAVGVDCYSDLIWDHLDEVPAELKLIVDRFTSPDFGMEKILAEPPRIADKEHFLTSLAEWSVSQERRQDDLLVLYWSGHGSVITEELALILPDTRADINRPIMRVRDLVDALLGDQSRLGQVLMILDVCCAGQGGLDMSERLSALTRVRNRYREPEIAAICATRSRTAATQSAFATAFVAALETCAAYATDRQPNVWLEELLLETNRRIGNDQLVRLYGAYSEIPAFRNPKFVARALDYESHQGLLGRIAAFEGLYQADDVGPTIFVGRKAELNRLDAWLSDTQADPRLLITSKAGRGKSALLVQWTRLLAERRRSERSTSWAVVFIPISIRFETSDPKIYFRLLALKLAEVVGVSVTAPAENPAMYYADQTRILLQRISDAEIRVLILLDGLDESVDQDSLLTLLPSRQSSTLRLVVTAREIVGDRDQSGWLARLGWPHLHSLRLYHFELEGLTPKEIGDALLRMGAPISRDIDLVRQLANLTEGEPLLLRLYFEDLWRKASAGAAVTVSDLHALNPGFSAYLNRWLELQERQWRDAALPIDLKTIDVLLSILAVAKSPIYGADLLAIFRELHPGLGALTTSQSLLAPLRRFVIGDVFNHPKLAEYIRYQRCTELISDVEREIVSWGLRHADLLNDGTIQVQDASRYVVQFLGYHLLDSDSTAATFMAFVENGWRRAWELFESGHFGFSRDVSLALQKQRRSQPAARLGAQLRCALVLSSIRSLSQAVFPDLIIACVETKIISEKQGQLYSELIVQDDDAIKLLSRLAVLSVAKHELCAEIADYALKRAIASCIDRRNCALLDTFLEGFSSIASALPILTYRAIIERALDWIRSIGDESAAVLAFASLSPYLSEDQVPSAVEVANSIKDEYVRAEVLMALATCLPSSQQQTNIVRQAIAIIEASRNRYYRAVAMHDLASRAPKTMQTEVFNAVLRQADAIEDSLYHCLAVSALAPHLPPVEKSQHLSAALESATQIDDESDRRRAILALAPTLEPIHFPIAMRLARTFTNQWRRSETLSALLPNMPMEMRWEGFIQALGHPAMYSNNSCQPAQIFALINYLPPEHQYSAISLCFDICKKIDEDRYRARSLAAFANCLPTDLTEPLSELVDRIIDAQSRVDVLLALAPCLKSRRRKAAIGEALAVAAGIEDERARIRAIATVIDALPSDSSHDLTSIIEAIQDSRAQKLLLGLRAPDWSPERALTRLDEAISRSRTTGDEEDWLEVLICLAAQQRPRRVATATSLLDAVKTKKECAAAMVRLSATLPIAQRRAATTAALELTRFIGDSTERFRLLSLLVSRIPLDRRGTIDRLGLEGIANASKDHEYVAMLDALVIGLDSQRASQIATLALNIAMSTRVEAVRIKAIIGLVPYLSQKAIATAFFTGRCAQDENDRAKFLVSVAPMLPPELVAPFLADVATLNDAHKRAEAMVALATSRGSDSDRQEDIVSRAVEAALAVVNESRRARLLTALAPRLSIAQLRAVVDIADAMTNEYVQTDLIVRLSEYLPPEEKRLAISRALALAESERIPATRVAMLGMVAPHLSSGLRLQAFESALKIAVSISNEDASATSFKTLAPLLPPELIVTAVSLGRRRYGDNSFSSILLAMAPHLTSSSLQFALREMVRGSSADRLVEFIVAVEPRLDLQDVLASAKGLDAGGTLRVLLACARRLDTSHMTKLLELIEDTRDEETQVAALSTILSYLNSKQIDVVLKIANSISRVSTRLQTLARLMRHLPYQQRIEIAQEIVDAIPGMSRRDAFALLSVAHETMSEIAGEESLFEIAKAVIDVGKWYE